LARFIRNYEVINKLGGGKFGEVFLSVGETPGRGLSGGKRRVVAVKKLRDKSNPEAAKLLMQEFSLLDQVKHRGIVRVFEYIEEEHAVVMEAVDGVNLRTVLEECDKAHEQVFTEAVIEIACEIADALYQAYTTPGDNGEPLRLVHRDLKPENIMLTPQGEVKILDFGLARVDNEEFTREDPNRLRGTPLYMAPEQARCEAVDHRTDLFALGLITYELLMNRAAYRVPEDSSDPVAEVYDAIERAALHDCVAELETKIPGMGPIIARCLQARPQSRYQNGQELLVDLRRQLYRDRGAYLEEFCEFFFGSIYEHEPLPKVETVQSAPSAGGGQRRRRMSIEERLKQSMERDSNAARSTPRAPTPPPAAPSRPTPSRAGGGQRARPFTPARPAPARPTPGPTAPSSSRKSAPKMVGARSPDETGMLEMVPLSEQGGGDDGGDDPSATAFFAIPAPKAEASKPAPPPPPSAPAAPPMGIAGPGAPPRAAGIQGPSPGAPPAAIQGPTVGGAGGTPFHAAQPPPAAPRQQKRVASYRVYAIILAVFVLGCSAVVLAVWLGGGEGDTPTPTPTPTHTTTVADADPEPARAKREDTAPPEPDPPPTRTRSTSTRSTSTAAAAPKAPSGPAALVVKMTDQTHLTAVEVNCPSGFRDRVGITTGGSASVPDVPQENCSLHFKGGVPARFSPVRGGQSLSCAIMGSTAVCK